jgi:putative pyrimidine permease RutG
VLAVAVVAARARGLPRRLSILLGAACGYACYALGANLLGLGAPIDFTPVAAAPWLSLPRFEAPAFSASAVALIAPVAVALVAEWPGATSTRCSGARSSPTARRRSSPVSAAGRGVTTYAENMGVMAATRVYSTLVFLVAACFALLLGLSPKFGALILTLPVPVLGGVSLVVFGLIAATGARIWAAHRVDLASPRNLLTAALALTAGAGDLTVLVGGFAIGGIGTATFRAILLYHLLSGGGETGSSGRAGMEADGAQGER